MAPKNHSGIGRGKGSGKKKTVATAQAQANTQTQTSIPEAKTIAEANQIAVQLGLAKNVDFTGLDISVANEMIAEMQATRELFSGLGELEILGNSMSVENHMLGRLRNYDAFGVYYPREEWGKSGLQLNLELFSPSVLPNTLRERQQRIKNLINPLGCGTAKGTISHEIAHWMDDSLGLHKDTRIVQLFQKYHGDDSFFRRKGEWLFGNRKMAERLSAVANTNIGEFIAEAWSEYRNNSSPRPLAKQVGDIIMTYKRK